MKIKSLAAESRIIRHHERRHPRRAELSDHRRGIVRQEARDSLVAYGFIRGRRYSQLEPGAKTPPRWDNVKRMVKKYGHKELPDDWRKT